MQAITHISRKYLVAALIFAAVAVLGIYVATSVQAQSTPEVTDNHLVGARISGDSIILTLASGRTMHVDLSLRKTRDIPTSNNRGSDGDCIIWQAASRPAPTWARCLDPQAFREVEWDSNTNVMTLTRGDGTSINMDLDHDYPLPAPQTIYFGFSEDTTFTPGELSGSVTGVSPVTITLPATTLTSGYFGVALPAVTTFTEINGLGPFSLGYTCANFFDCANGTTTTISSDTYSYYTHHIAQNLEFYDGAQFTVAWTE